MTNPLIIAYRHDIHKALGRSHDDAHATFAGVPVNDTPPHNADPDAAALSRPDEEPQTPESRRPNYYRVSLVTGRSCFVPGHVTTDTLEPTIARIARTRDPVRMHQKWLTCDAVTAFNEHPRRSSTSLKYHTLLTAALVDAYQDDHTFADLQLVADTADTIYPHRTIFTNDRLNLSLHLTPTDDAPGAPIGDAPTRNWATVWSNLPEHPLPTGYDFDAPDTTYERLTMYLDHTLRHLGAWSTALQYIEDFAAAYLGPNAPTPDAATEVTP